MATSVPGLVAKKRDGHELDDGEMHTFVSKVVDRDIHESQIGAMLMAMYLQGLSREETKALTKEMILSGESLSWPAEWEGLLVDKHSTGGVGDKVSLVLAPALAAVGLKVPMISGRGLGHTGGTLDKLEAIPGYRVQLTHQEMTAQLEKVGCFIAGQTDNVCPADKKLYALRDVTATVSNIGLITASIISKKAAEKINTLILDVKTGKGAFMSEVEQAVKISRSMVDCSTDLGIKTAALITDMNSPLGNMIGNALEVVESIQCLQGKGPADVDDLVIELGGHALATNGTAPTVQDGRKRIREVIDNGQALSKFKDMIQGHGVTAQVADDLCDVSKDPRMLLPHTSKRKEMTCASNGYVRGIDSMSIAVTTHKLGGGRNKPGDALNLGVGVELLVGVGTQVSQGQPWAIVHYDEDEALGEVTPLMDNALDVSDTPVERTPRLLRVVT